MMSSVDDSKKEKMWSRILKYEKGDGMYETDKSSASTIIKIIDEVYKECI
jgi:hypothetical protein